MTRPSVLHLLNGLGPGTAPFVYANRIDPAKFDVTIGVYYSNNEFFRNEARNNPKLIGFGAKSRLDIAAWRRLFSLIRGRRIDIIHTHHHLTGSLARAVNILGRKKIIIHSFGNEFRRASMITRLVHSATVPLVNAVLCVSNSTLSSLNFPMDFLARHKSYVIYNGVDVAAVANVPTNNDVTRKELGLNSDDFVIGSVGRLIPVKDQATLIRAVAQVAKQKSFVKLLLIGHGPTEESLKALANQLGIARLVKFTGQVARDRVYQYLHAADLFVMTSVSEGLSVAALEAMAARKPIILTRIPSFVEIIEDGKSGRLVPVGDFLSLANEITSLIENPTLAMQFALSAKERVHALFSIENTALGYEQLYSQLLARFE